MRSLAVTLACLCLAASGCMTSSRGTTVIPDSRSVVPRPQSAALSRGTTCVAGSGHQQGAPLPAAQENESRVPGLLLQRMLTAYKTFRYDDVIELADQVVVHPIASSQQRADAWLLTGAAWYLKGNNVIAKECFRRARMLVSGLRPNADFFPEGILRLFEETDR